MYDGDLDPLEEVNQYLEGNVKEGHLPTTPQDEVPHKDGLFGRTYEATHNEASWGRTGGTVVNQPTSHGDHYDVIEKDPASGTMYHNRIYEP